MPIGFNPDKFAGGAAMRLKLGVFGIVAWAALSPRFQSGHLGSSEERDIRLQWRAAGNR